MSFQPWLPKDAFWTAEGKALLAEPIAQWSTQWFARTTATVTRLREDGRSPSAPRGAELCGTQARLEISGNGKRHFLEAMLNLSLAEQTRSESDNQVLDALMAAAGQDLICRLDNVLAPGDEDDGAWRLRYTLSIGRNEALDIVVPAASLIPLLKRQFKTCRPILHPLGQRRAALRQTHIVARAVLGQAELSLDEVKGLATGDVLILDRGLNETIEMRVPGNDRPFARGHLQRNGNRNSIQL